MNRADIIDLLAAIAAVDRRTIGQADVIVWHDIIGGLPKDLAFQAARNHFRECPGVYLEPGHIYQRVRAIRQDQLEREPDEIREARQEQLAAKVEQDAAELAEAKSIPAGDPKFRRPKNSPLRVPCPWCKAGVGSPCTIVGSRTPLRREPRFHPSRIDAAAPPQPPEDAAWPACTACGKNPLVTDEDRDRGVCTPCQQAATPQQPETEVPERNQA
jgi:hypothetical protein